MFANRDTDASKAPESIVQCICGIANVYYIYFKKIPLDPNALRLSIKMSDHEMMSYLHLMRHATRG